MSTRNQVVKHLRARRKQSEREVEKLSLAIKALTSLERTSVGTSVGIRRKPKFSAAARGRIAAAQRARWAKIKAAQKK
jgi:hypothetical protein